MKAKLNVRAENNSREIKLRVAESIFLCFVKQFALELLIFVTTDKGYSAAENVN